MKKLRTPFAGTCQSTPTLAPFDQGGVKGFSSRSTVAQSRSRFTQGTHQGSLVVQTCGDGDGRRPAGPEPVQCLDRTGTASGIEREHGTMHDWDCGTTKGGWSSVGACATRGDFSAWEMMDHVRRRTEA